MNPTITDEESDLVLEYFGASENPKDKTLNFDYILFYLFLDCKVDFFSIFHAYHEHQRTSNSDFDYLFALADLDEDQKLSQKEYNNFLKEIKVKEIHVKEYTEIFYFLAEKKENFIAKTKLRMFLEDFEETFENSQKKTDKKGVFEENLHDFSFQALKNDKIAAKKYIFFKYADVLPFLVETSSFIIKEFKNPRIFEEKIFELFVDLTAKKDFEISKVQFKLRLVKFHDFFSPMRISKFVDILNNKKTNKCDVEEFLFLLQNFEEVFHSKFNKDDKIVILMENYIIFRFFFKRIQS